MTDERADTEHEARLEAIGLLVAGALAPAERMDTEAHLRTCSLCQAELVDIASLPGLLGRLRPELPQDLGPARTPVPGARSRLLAAGAAASTRQRRARGVRYALAACVVPVLLGLGAVGASLGGPGGAEQPELVAMQRVDEGVAVSGELAVSAQDWGSAVDVEMTWGKGGRAVLVAVAHDGRTDQAASWTAPAGDVVLCAGATSMRPDEIARFEVQNDAGVTLLTLQS